MCAMICFLFLSIETHHSIAFLYGSINFTFNILYALNIPKLRLILYDKLCLPHSHVPIRQGFVTYQCKLHIF